MAVVASPATADAVADRLRRTALLLEARGYAVTPDRLGRLCLGGAVAEVEVRRRCAAAGVLRLEGGLAVAAGSALDAGAVAERARRHATEGGRFDAEAVAFARFVVRWLPFVRSVAVAGSLASGGFVATDDVDLNLLVAPGRRHLAYVAVNLLGVLHALRHRGKPVDDSSARPVAPRVMTVNLVVEAGRPLARDDEQMALELLLSRPVAGRAAARRLVIETPALARHFPQLLVRHAEAGAEPTARLPLWLFPRALDAPARVTGELAWRWLMWTRRRRPAALRRVEFVRATMRPYALFDRLP